MRIRKPMQQGSNNSPLILIIVRISLIFFLLKYSVLTHYSIFVYADDIILLCPSRAATQHLLNICNVYSLATGILFNYSKCKVMIFNTNALDIHHLSLNNVPLSVVNADKHLGHLLQSKGDLINFDAVIYDLKAKCSCIVRLFSHLNLQSKSMLFRHFCNTFYGCQLIDISSKQFQDIYLNWRKSARYTMNLPLRTHCDLLPQILSIPSADVQIYSRMICFMRNGLTHASNYISFFFSNCLYASNSYMYRNTQLLCRKINIKVEEIAQKSVPWLKRAVRGLLPPPD